MNIIKEEKIVYLGINSSYSHSSLAYGQLRSFTEQQIIGCQWEYVNVTINDDVATVVSLLLKTSPNIITGTVYLFNYEFLMKVLKSFSQLKPNVKIILGGPEFLGDNESFLKNNSNITGVIRGDETTFYKILSDTSFSKIEGLCYLNDDNIYCDNNYAAFAEKSLDKLPSLFKDGYFVKDKPFYQIETSRGCMAYAST